MCDLEVQYKAKPSNTFQARNTPRKRAGSQRFVRMEGSRCENQRDPSILNALFIVVLVLIEDNNSKTKLV